MLKLATVFSGIGAIEHALDRMGIEYQTMFACDNGGVDIFSKKIKPNLSDINHHVHVLSEKVETIQLEHFNDAYALNLIDHLKELSGYISEIKMSLFTFQNNILKDDTAVKYLNQLFPNGELSTFIDEENLKFDFLKLKEKIKKLKSENKTNTFSENTTAFLNHFDPIIKSDLGKNINYLIGSVISAINMLYERIETVEVLDALDSIESHEEKKAYVDSLYNGKEKSNFVMKSYLANYKIDQKHFHWNASFLDGTYYENDVDLFVGGSPCQSFSLVGKRRGLQDTRGTLFYEFARLIDEIKPKVFIYENVKGLLGHDNGNTWETMKQIFKDLNYEWDYQVLNSKDFGIPQNRERLFVVGFRKDLNLKKNFSFPTPVPLDKKMKDFLLDNVAGKYYLNKKGVEFVTKQKNIDKRYTQVDGEIQLCQKANQQFNWHGDFIFVSKEDISYNPQEDLEKYFLSEKVEKYVMSSGTKNFYSRPEIDLDVARPLLTSMHKMHRAGIDNYVTTEGRIRKLTPRECLRLMGFCDSFKIDVSDTQMYQQAGNSIVVDVLIAVVTNILESIPELTKTESSQQIMLEL